MLVVACARVASPPQSPCGDAQANPRNWGACGHDYGIAVELSLSVLVVGTSHDIVDLGATTLTAAGGWDGYLARLAP